MLLAAVHADIIDEDQSVADSHVDRAFGTGGMNLEERYSTPHLTLSPALRR